MKQLIIPIAIIVTLIAFFVIIDRKEFHLHDNVQTVQGVPPATNRKPTVSASQAKPVTEVKPVVETKPVAETKPMTETKPAEARPAKTKPAAETKTAEMKPTETTAFAETKPEEKVKPAAVPVVTPEEAERRNEEAKIFAEKHAKRMLFTSKGMYLVYDDKMNLFVPVSIAERFDETFKKNGVVKTRSELLTRKIPYGWAIDYNSLRGNCDFDRQDNSYKISSPDGVLIITTPERQVLNTITGISFELSSNNAETTVKVGIEEHGLFRPGKTYIGVLSGIFDKECINYEISALEHFDTVCPFLEIKGDVTVHGLRIYQKEINGLTYLEGQIIERSVLPDPKESDYPNCRYTAHFDGNVIKGGVPCPKEIALIVDGFDNYKTLRTDTVKKNDKILCAVVPYDTLSDEEQSIQLADDLNLFTLDNYYVLWMRKLNAYADEDSASFPSSGVYFADEKKEHISIYNRHINPPVSKELQEAKKRAITEDINEIDKMLTGYDAEEIKKINAVFSQAWKDEQAKDISGRNVIYVDTNRTKYIWKQIDNSFFTLPPGLSVLISTNTVSEENLAALVELNKVLEENGVQLILSIIQDKDPISARIVNDKFRDIPDYQMYTVVKTLLEHGIETITPSKDSVRRFNEEEFVYNVGNDGHPSILIQKIVSEILAKRLERYKLPKRLKKNLFKFQEEKHHFYGYDPLRTYPENCDIGSHKPGDEIKVRKPTLPNEYSYINNNSEVLVIGNSFSASPYSSYGLVSWLDYNLETDVSYYYYGMNGPATVFINNLLMDPEKYLKGKKVAIIQFPLSHLLYVQWHNIFMLDRQLTLLSSSKHVSTIPIQQQDVMSPPSGLSDNQMLVIGLLKGFVFKATDDEFEIANTAIETNNKKSLIVIPACLVSGNVSITVNGNTQTIPSSPNSSANSYQTLIYEISADTKELSVSVKGNNNSIFVIKDIELWQ